MLLKIKKIFTILTIIFLTTTLICCDYDYHQKQIMIKEYFNYLMNDFNNQNHKKKNEKKPLKHKKRKKTIKHQKNINNQKKKKINIDNETTLIIDEIKKEIDHLDISNNVINNEQKRLQHCQVLIKKINAYQDKDVYQLLLPLQKTLIKKAKVIKKEKPLFINKLIMIIIDFWFGYQIIMNTYYLYENKQYQKKIENCFQTKNKKEKNQLSKTLYKKIIKDLKDETNNLYQFMSLATLRMSTIINKITVIYYFRFFYYLCFYSLINITFNHFFSNDNKRLFNTIKYFFFHQKEKKKLNHYFFIIQKKKAHFCYHHLLLTSDDQQLYYYVPLLFDGTSNYFLNICHLFYCFFFLISLFPYAYYFGLNNNCIINFTNDIINNNDNDNNNKRQLPPKTLSINVVLWKMIACDKIIHFNLFRSSYSYHYNANCFWQIICFLIKDQYLNNDEKWQETFNNKKIENGIKKNLKAILICRFIFKKINYCLFFFSLFYLFFTLCHFFIYHCYHLQPLKKQISCLMILIIIAILLSLLSMFTIFKYSKSTNKIINFKKFITFTWLKLDKDRYPDYVNAFINYYNAFFSNISNEHIYSLLFD